MQIPTTANEHSRHEHSGLEQPFNKRAGMLNEHNKLNLGGLRHAPLRKFCKCVYPEIEAAGLDIKLQCTQLLKYR